MNVIKLRWGSISLSQNRPVVMGPGLRQDDTVGFVGISS
jgi:hypothetical protein